jgi:hypothetical protein
MGGGEHLRHGQHVLKRPAAGVRLVDEQRPHRANLLSPNYIDIGLGYMYRADSSYGGYFTAVFARP